MIATSTSSSTNSRFRYGNPSVECNGAELHKQCRQLATVLTITGSIDEVNVGQVVAQAKGCIIAEKPFVLDLSGVTSFAAQGIELLDAIDEACYAAGDEWSLVISQAVSRTLRLCGVDDVFPATPSVPDALHHFSDVAGERRRILPILTKSA
ncbi:anti-anti-sigma factor [Mycobacterium sp. Root135]|jgi:anti-anti-sigma factor|uniref:STAS domain-containing protein n=1 Tax=Mycobacterium sp. Root135 TaxID=1736457 RepID=UPI0006FCBD05|nr:STAS domain-containing protein [Mycobacterium sp. Root135]KQY04081.1 anti-anti-sigma factor [Mycobacterium sp. Root135]